jgi:hypothetical protein
MTNTFNFQFPVANKLYNLWNDIIMPNISKLAVLTPQGVVNVTDTSFSFNNFTPKNVKSLKYQSQNAIVNPNNGGAVLTLYSDNYGNQLGEELLSGSWDAIDTERNNITLSDIYFAMSIAGAGINVTFTH